MVDDLLLYGNQPMTLGQELFVLGAISFAVLYPLIMLFWGVYARRKAVTSFRANVPDSPLQILERRFASGEISAQEFQDERYELEKGK